MAAELDNLAIEVEVDGLRGRVSREVEDDREGRRNAVLDRLLKLAEKVEFRTDRHVAHRSAGHDEAECMNRIRRVRDKNDVARRGDRLGQITQPLFRTEGNDYFAFGIELDLESPGVIGG